MDRGTDAAKMIRGEEIPLRLGYVGLKLRSQQDIKEGMKVKRAIQEEAQWFAEHPKYGKLPPGMTVFPRLSARETAQRQRNASRNLMLRTLALRQLGKSMRNKSKKMAESPELDPVKLGMDDLRRLFDDTPITPCRYLYAKRGELALDLGELQQELLLSAPELRHVGTAGGRKVNEVEQHLGLVCAVPRHVRG